MPHNMGTNELALDIGVDGVVSVADGGVDVALANVAADFNRWRREQGLTGKVYARGGKKKVRTFSVSDDAYAGLKYLAQAHSTMFGDSTYSVSALIEAIGTFQLRVSEM